MRYIGVDLGTSAVKLILMDETGSIFKSVSKEYPISFPKPGWSEQNPYDWYEQVEAGIAELVKDGNPRDIAGISFGGQMHGLVILDENDEVIRPAILWNDGRTVKECEFLNGTIGRGVHCTDYSDASGMLLLDVKNKCWSKEMLQICEIRESQLPKLFESYDKVGVVKPDIAEKLGLSNDVTVAAGAGDNAAAAVGTGTIGDGCCNISLGTSGTIFISSRKFGVDKNNALHSFAHADGAYHLMGCMLSAASCNKWWMDDISGTKEYGEEQAAISDSMLGCNHTFFLPYLMGERSPHNNPNARGTFTGMTMDTTRADMTQAVLEGVAFAIRDSFEIARSLGIDITRTKICGGGAKSPLWRKIIANVLNIDVDIPLTEEGPALGAAMLAMVACGAYKDVDDAAKAIVKISDTVHPDSDIAGRYEKQYSIFTEIYPALKGVFDKMAFEQTAK